MNPLLDCDEVKHLATLIEESTSSTEEGVKRFEEPGPGYLRRAKSKQHHIIFGRRGSGKTSLLKKAAADLDVKKLPIAYANLTIFKGQSYPDVLLNTLIASFEEFSKWLKESKHPSRLESLLSKFFKKKENLLLSNLTYQITQLKKQLHSTDDVKLSKKTKQGQVTVGRSKMEGQIGFKDIGVSGECSGIEEISKSEEVIEDYYRSKAGFLEQNIVEYQKIFREISELSGGTSYLFLDDLYHIRRSDQAKVLDYLRRIAKESNLWLKIGTIRHRTNEYIPGDPPIGIKIGDDAHQIDLDLSLKKYQLTKDFLVKILNKFVTESGLRSIRDIMTDDAINRLVLASGGVARDFLGVFIRSIDFALERGIDHKKTKRRRAGPKICVEDVNKAAGEYDSIKRNEFKKDTLDDQSTLEKQFNQIRDFCITQANANIFLLNKDTTGQEIALMKELVDLRLTHLVNDRITVRKYPRETFEAYMLDISQYTGSRKRRNLKIIEFWRKGGKELLRQARYVYDPSC